MLRLVTLTIYFYSFSITTIFCIILICYSLKRVHPFEQVWEIVYSKDGSVKEVSKVMQLKGHKVMDLILTLC